MSFDEIQTGSVIFYPYLWVREAVKGESAGRKSRPTTVGVRWPRANGDLLLLFPITTKQPVPEQLRSIPETEKRRAGLSVDRRLWIVLDEYNEDVVGRSFHLEPRPPQGRFSKAFFLPVLRRFLAYRERASRVSRR